MTTITPQEKPHSNSLAAPFVEVENLRVEFRLPRTSLMARDKTVLKAVAGVSFSIARGETFSIVGESGSGKSTTGRAILQLPTQTSGKVTVDGIDVASLSTSSLRDMRRRMQMIFQDPYASVNRRMTVGDIIAEPMVVHSLYMGRERKPRVAKLMELVGLNPDWCDRYPHEFSGGQLQRIGIARALAVDPDFIVADEPVSALDVSVQAQVINLLEKLQRELGLTLLFIAHDLSVVRHLSDRVAVMYLGQLVEIADCETLYSNPRHPYTKALLSAIPVPDPVIEAERSAIILEGEIPSPLSPPSGCPFRTRCWKVQDECISKAPALKTIDGGSQVACHFPEPASSGVTAISTEPNTTHRG